MWKLQKNLADIVFLLQISKDRDLECVLKSQWTFFFFFLALIFESLFHWKIKFQSLYLYIVSLVMSNQERMPHIRGTLKSVFQKSRKWIFSSCGSQRSQGEKRVNPMDWLRHEGTQMTFTGSVSGCSGSCFTLLRALMKTSLVSPTKRLASLDLQKWRHQDTGFTLSPCLPRLSIATWDTKELATLWCFFFESQKLSSKAKPKRISFIISICEMYLFNGTNPGSFWINY